jgi:hypothetical protein
MKNIVTTSLALLLLSACGWAAEDVVTAVHGTITKIDTSTKSIVVKSKDGSEDTLKFVDKTTVHGTKDMAHGLIVGADVVVHYTTEGTEKIAVEVDKVGKDGLKSMDGTITHIDRAGKTVAVKTADGTEETFKVSGYAASDAGKDIAKGTEKSAKVTVYYSEESGKKVAHFFEKI